MLKKVLASYNRLHGYCDHATNSVAVLISALPGGNRNNNGNFNNIGNNGNWWSSTENSSTNAWNRNMNNNNGNVNRNNNNKENGFSVRYVRDLKRICLRMARQDKLAGYLLLPQ